MTTTQITTINIDLTPVVGEFADDFDMDAVVRDYLDELARVVADQAPVSITRNGDVYVDVEHAEAAREIDWHEADGAVNIEPILRRNERPSVSPEQITALRSEAGNAGDYELVADCNKALHGDADALASCEQVIRSARDAAAE